MSLDAMLRHAGLPLGLFQHEQDFPDNRRDVRLYGAIHEISGDPGIGLKLGRYQRPEHYSPIAIVALYTRSFRETLDRIASLELNETAYLLDMKIQNSFIRPFTSGKEHHRANGNRRVVQTLLFGSTDQALRSKLTGGRMQKRKLGRSCIARRRHV